MLQRRTFLGLLAGLIGTILSFTRALKPSSSWKRPTRVQAAPPVGEQSATLAENHLGLKITTVRRSTTRNALGQMFDRSYEEIFYIQGEWRRSELPRTFRGGDSSTPRIYGPRVVTIVRPDLRQQFDLNLDASQYSQRSLDWLYSLPKAAPELRGLTKEELQARGIKMPPPPGDTVTFRIETITKDSGERKEVFGYVARHVITTRKEIPLQASHRAAQEMTKDGWYIDLESEFYPALYWLPHSSSGKSKRIRDHAYLVGDSPVPEKPEFVDIGEPETGFALQELQIAQLRFTLPDRRTVHEKLIKTETLVTLEKGTYDVSLFEVPPGFKRVTKINRNPA